MIEITLPWPDKRLSPNKRLNRWVMREAAEEARQVGKINALTSPTAPPKLMLFRDQNVTYVLHPPTKRRMDDDNAIAMLKHYRDGVADAYMIDDKRFHLQPIEWGDVVKGGKVVLRLEEMNDGNNDLNR